MLPNLFLNLPTNLLNLSSSLKISDELKDLMYQKAAKRVEDLRPKMGNAMFDEIEDEVDEVDTEPQEEE